MVVKIKNRELRQFVNSQANDSQKHDALYEAHQRIRQLEQLNATLAAEIDRMTPVIEAAWIAMRFGKGTNELHAALLAYEASKPK